MAQENEPAVHPENERFADVISEDGEDHNVLRPGRKSLGLDQNYVPDWTPCDVFRELCQNWKDSIIDTFKINPKQVLLEIEDSDKDYVAKFNDPQPRTAANYEPMLGRLLGYIRYSKQNGTLELTNFKAQLGRQALKAGFAIKRQNSGMAGTNGEGLNVASLVLPREGYQIRFEASKFYWNFRLAGVEKDTLYCFFSTPKDSTIQKQISTYQGKMAKSGLRELMFASLKRGHPAGRGGLSSGKARKKTYRLRLNGTEMKQKRVASHKCLQRSG